MEPHTIDLAHDLRAPHFEGIYGPMLWVDASAGRVWQEGSAGQGTPEPGSATSVLLVWVGTPVVVVSQGVREEDRAAVTRAVRAFLRRAEAPIVFELGWLPEKVGTSIAVEAPDAVPRREVARAEAYALVQARWFAGENVAVELGPERFTFAVGTALDASGRLHATIG